MNWAIQANRPTSGRIGRIQQPTVESVETRINLGCFCIKFKRFKLNQFLISNLFQVNFNAAVRS